MVASNPLITVESLHKAYVKGGARTLVLKGIDLQIAAGECVFLAGPSGSGKSTLLSILGCILTPDAGRVEILGHDLGRLRPQERSHLRRDRIGFVFQRFQLIRGLTALENVCVPSMLKGLAAKKAQARGQELLAAVGLAQKFKSQAANLSTGQCQRVALARALMADPDLILADEPTASLDSQSGLEAMRLLRELTTQRGKTAIVVTHDPRIFQFADRVLHLDEGRICPEPQTPSLTPLSTEAVPCSN